jgi:hypothetical protein
MQLPNAILFLSHVVYSDGSAHYPVEEDTYELPSEGFVPTSEHFAEGYTDAEFQETHTILADGGDRFGVSAVAFDQQEELLWMGNQGVSIVKIYVMWCKETTSCSTIMSFTVLFNVNFSTE